MEAGQVLLFTGGVFGGGVAAVYVRLLLCGSIAAFYVWCTPDMRFRCGVLHLVHVRYTVLLWRFVFDHACCLPPVRQTGRLAGCCVSIPPGRDRHSCVLEVLARLSALAGSLRVWTFFYGDLDGITGDAGYGAGGAAFMLFCATTLALLCFPRGVRWGCAPQTAPKSLRLSGLSSRCGGVMLVRIRAAVTRVHGKTRPALIYGRTGRAVLRCYLYTPTSRLEPPSSGAESGCTREAVWPAALPPQRPLAP